MARAIETQCCIVGGGPAGMMLGLLLARAGVDVCVLEKHGDFLRDFRGDTIHPSTLELMYELGLLHEFLKRPHQEVRQISAQVGNETVTLGDFTHLPTHCKFLALMPQWDFLNFLVEQASSYPTFHLKMKAEVREVVEENGRIVGVRAQTADGPQDVASSLTVGADGRHSVVREQAGLQVIDLGAPMDVLWMRLSRKPTDPGQTLGHADAGKMLVLIDREEYWQCAFVIPKGSGEELRQRGMGAFREDIVRLSPFLRDRVDELRDWNDVSLLTVKVDRLARWYRPGLLCIGDAAHAMSPIGGVGINLAIQDAVATANILAEKLLKEIPGEVDLEKVQRRREFPTRATQRLQIAIQNRIIKRVLDNAKPGSLPGLLKVLKYSPYLQRIPARIIGVGFRPEHVRTQARQQNVKRAA
jgi:2-polyprenyl-6-methoxyphenol hydroxylase-like FAD-dependent oxidoreductase